MLSFLKLYVGKYKRLFFTVTDTETNLPLNISSGVTFVFTIKRDKLDPDSSALVQKTSGSGISIVDGPNGKGQIDILPADTAAVPEVDQPIVWDLQIDRTSYPEIVADGTGIMKVPVTRISS